MRRRVSFLFSKSLDWNFFIGGLCSFDSHYINFMHPKPPPLTPNPIPDPVYSLVEVVPKTDYIPYLVVGVYFSGDSKIRALGFKPVSYAECDDDDRPV